MFSTLLAAFFMLISAQPTDDFFTPSDFVRSHIIARAYTLEMTHNGEAVGTARYEILPSSGTILLKETTVIERAKVNTVIETTLDSASLMPLRCTVQGDFFGQKADVDVKFADGKATGHSVMPRAAAEPQGRIEVDTALAAHVLERTSVFFLLNAMPLKEGAEIPFEWFNTYNARKSTLTAEVSNGGVAEVPAGSFDCWKVVLRGGMPDVAVYIEKSDSRRIVRMDVLQSPWGYRLLPKK